MVSGQFDREAGGVQIWRVLFGAVVATYIVVPQDFSLLENVRQDLSHQAARLVSWVVGVWDQRPLVHDNTMMTSLGPWKMLPGCLGMIYVVIGCFVIFAYPTRGWLKVCGTLLLETFVEVLNMGRIVGHFFLWKAGYTNLVDFVHRGTGGFFAVLIGGVFAAFLWWDLENEGKEVGKGVLATGGLSVARLNLWKRPRLAHKLRLAAWGALVLGGGGGFVFGTQCAKYFSWASGWYRWSLKREKCPQPENIDEGIRWSLDQGLLWSIPVGICILSGVAAVCFLFSVPPVPPDLLEPQSGEDPRVGG